MQYQGDSIRRRTGGRRRPKRSKKKHELGRSPAETVVDEPRIRTINARGTVEKQRALAIDTANVSTGDEMIEADIEDVVENQANPNYVRRNIITKGAVIETSEGRARVTSRPGQEGQVNAVLIDDS